METTLHVIEQDNFLITPPTRTADLGNNLLLEFYYNCQIIVLFNNGVKIKTVDLSDKVAKKLLVTELVELGAVKKRISEVLKISRQTIHNYVEVKKYFGLEGLIQGYTPSDTKNLREQRKLHADKRPHGNKVRQVEELRRQERQEVIEPSCSQAVQTLSDEQQPFAKKCNWTSSRYAGLFTYIIVLVAKWGWFSLILKLFGASWQIFMVFLLMAGKNIRSIEQ